MTLGHAYGRKGEQEAEKLSKFLDEPDVRPRQAVDDDFHVRAATLVDTYVDKVNDGDIGLLYTIKQSIKYWEDLGEKLFPEIAQVAMSVLAFPGGSGNLERDFCKSGNLITKQRGSMDYR